MTSQQREDGRTSVNRELDDLKLQLAGKYMTFNLAEEQYGLKILTVREIIGLMEITRVPRTPGFIRGVINLRGKVIPVIDVRMKFNMGRTTNTDQTVIIVVQVPKGDGELTMGILVDEVLEVVDIPRDQVEPPPDFGQSEIDTDFILGLGKVENRVILLLDIGRVLDANDAQNLERVAGTEV